MSKIYKIRNKKDQTKFINGTPAQHRYDSTGRLFPSVGSVKSFLAIVLRTPEYRSGVSEWEIVEYDANEVNKYEVHEVASQNTLTRLLLSDK